MRLRRALASAAAGIALVVGANEALSRAAPDLEPPLAGRQRTYRWRGIDVAYTEAGDADDPTLVLLHGINAAASAGEYREVFAPLSESYHVVAPDLPGFGCSDRPPLRYSAAVYEDFVADFLGEFAVDDDVDVAGDDEADDADDDDDVDRTEVDADAPAVVASSLTAAYAAAAAKRTPVSSLTLLCPTAVAGPEPPRPFVQELLRLPVVGEALFNLLASRPSIRYFNADHGYVDPTLPGPAWERYEWTTTHQPNARFAPASFVAGALNSDRDLGSVLADLDVPVTLLWGREADLAPLSDGRVLAEAADARLVVVDHAKLMPHVEHPDALLSELGVASRDEPVTVARDRPAASAGRE